jgi:hypothetical protein
MLMELYYMKGTNPDGSKLALKLSKIINIHNSI